MIDDDDDDDDDKNSDKNDRRNFDYPPFQKDFVEIPDHLHPHLPHLPSKDLRNDWVLREFQNLSQKVMLLVPRQTTSSEE